MKISIILIIKSRDINKPRFGFEFSEKVLKYIKNVKDFQMFLR
jgi:hypothetical protein